MGIGTGRASVAASSPALGYGGAAGRSSAGGFFDHLLVIVAAVALVGTLVAAGFFVCCIPGSTTALARAFSLDDISPFTKDQLVRAAEVTRDYTIDTNDLDALVEMLASINDEAQTLYAGATREALLQASSKYTLPSNAIVHLDQVFEVVKTARPVLFACIGVSVALIAVLAVRRKRRCCGAALLCGGVAVLLAFAVVGGYALIDFDGFFGIFHSLFFAEGTWKFPYNSLLICMYPEEFWIGMGVIWFGVTALASVVSIAVGRKLLGRMRVRRLR